jgi:hypothetical protein
MKSLKLPLCFLLLLQFIFLHTTAQTGKIDSTQMATIRIDPQSARGAAVSQIFDEVKFIPLETTKESLFGNIAQLKVATNKYLIYDYDTKAILIFSDEGKYINKIDATKLQTDKEDKEKAQSYGFRTVNEDGNNYIVVFTGNNVQYFTMDGKFIKKVKNYSYSDEIKMSNGNTLAKLGMYIKKGKDSTYYRLNLIDKVKKDTVGYFKFDTKLYETDDWYGDGGISQYAPNEAFWSNFYDYNLYKITPEKVSLAYKFILPAINTLPKDFITNPIYVKKRFEYFEKNKKIIHGLGKSYLLGDNLYIRFSNIFWDKDQKKNLIYNIKTSELISFQDLEPDSLSSFLPITDSGFGYDFENRGFLAFEDGKFYTSYSSLAMFAFKERSAGKTLKYPPLLENYFKNADRKSNPVLVIFKPKTN